jgi:5-methylcytosine-specific restriction protein B
MAIPKNITREHIQMAISEIIVENIPTQRLEQHYSIIENGKTLPPKYVISIANKYANGIELNSDEFNAVEAKTFLVKNNFNVVDKRAKTITYYVLGAAWSGDENGPDQSERIIQNGIWENGYEDKFLDVVNKVNIGDRVAIKSSFATRDGKSILRVKAIGTVHENLGDGKNLKINWDKNFVPFDLEGHGGYRNTIQKVSSDDIDIIFNSNKTMNYYPELNKFLKQAKTPELGTSTYLNNFQGLSVKVSFGKGNQARIPWIAFLNGTNNVQEGIYPVYLLYKEKNLLILAYGVSETHTSHRKWNISNVKTIEQFFADSNLGKPERYGSSFVFKSYEITKVIVEEEINNDLNKLISIYKANSVETKSATVPTLKFNHTTFLNSAQEAGYFIEEKFCSRFCASLLTKPFVILTGLSGSGKTKLAQAFVQWICQDKSQYRIIPVGADWTNREPLLGYPNALKPEEYVKPDSGVLDLIIQANKEPELPHFLILDEMNLSHVERYFADFLSVMESKEEIPLYAEGTVENGVPSNLKVPSNLFIIGTVNIDETTNMFSPKVLDRANTIEFHVTQHEMQNFLGNIKEINMEALTGKGAAMAKSFLEMAANKDFVLDETINTTLVQFFGKLKKTGAEFGYRSATEILRLIHQLTVLDAGLTKEQKIDIAIIQKLLPKVHGSRRKLCPVLETLGSFCIDGDVIIVKDVFEQVDFDFNSSNVLYPLSLEKISRMYRGAIDNGFASFAEA